MRQRFLALDALRGIAALGIFVRHVPEQTLAHLLPGSYLAVDLFFLLSGFVLAHAYTARFREGLKPGDFMAQRYLRLAPAYFAGCVFGLAILIWFDPPDALDPARMFAALGSAALFLPDPLPFAHKPDAPFPLNGPAWSLFFELVANGLLAAMLFSRRNFVLPVMSVGLAALVAAAFLHGSLDGGYTFSNAWVGLARVLFAFFAGVLIYSVWKSNKHPFSVPAPLLALVMLGVFAVPASGAIRPIVDLAAVTVVFPALIYLGASARVNVLAGASIWLGAISYPLYAIHGPALRLITQAAEKYLQADIWLRLGISGSVALLGICLGLAMLVDQFVDQPARSRLGKFLLRPKQARDARKAQRAV